MSKIHNIEDSGLAADYCTFTTETTHLWDREAPDKPALYSLIAQVGRW